MANYTKRLVVLITLMILSCAASAGGTAIAMAPSDRARDSLPMEQPSGQWQPDLTATAVV